MTPAVTTARRRRGPHPWTVLGVLTLVNAMSQAGPAVLSAVLPMLKSEFGFSDSELGVLTGYGSAVSYALLALPISHWAARRGSSLLLTLSMLVCGVANAVTASCSALWHFVAVRLASGTGPAAAWPLGQALIADHFPPAKRSGALAMHAAGDFIGNTVPLVAGGWIAVHYGWRTAFMVLGIATIAVALLQRWLVKDDAAPAAEAAELADDTTPTHWADGLRELWRRPSYVHIVMGFSWASFAVYGLSQWMPSFYNRQFGLAPDEAAAFFGGAYAGGAMLGLLLGGVIGNLVGAQRPERLLVFCMGTYALTFPCILGVLFAPNLHFAFAAHVLATMFGAMPNGPVTAMIQNSVPRPLRVLAASVFLLMLTLLGAGGGPLLIGIVSDALTASQAHESLKYAMLAVKLLGLMLFLHLGLAWRQARRDARISRSTNPALSPEPEGGAR